MGKVTTRSRTRRSSVLENVNHPPCSWSGRLRSRLRFRDRQPETDEATGRYKFTPLRRDRQAETIEAAGEYHYTALRGNDIRLIDLLPGKYEDELQICVHHYPLEAPRERPEEQLKGTWFFRKSDEVPLYRNHPSDPSWVAQYATEVRGHGPFEALSYTWGGREQLRTLQVVPRQQGIYITANLDVALRNLRFTDRIRTLWVDAVCINQKDDNERSAQVPRMGDIYGSARRVLAWLGPATHNSGLALRALEYVGKQVEISDDLWRAARAYADDLAIDPTLYRYEVDLSWTVKQCSAISTLLKRAWYERLWVVQEIALARHAILRCGDEEITYHDFRRAVATLHGKCGIPAELDDVLNGRQLIAYGKANLGLLDILALSHVQGCEDDHDKVYGVMSLLKPELRERLQSSYTKSYVDAFKDLFLVALSVTGRLDHLSICFPSMNYNGPSWVPDLRSTRGVDLLIFKTTWASGMSRAILANNPMEPHILQAAGRLKCTVTKIYDKLCSDSDIAIAHMLREIMPDKLMAATYPTGESMLNIWAKALSLDFVGKRFQGESGLALNDWKDELLARRDLVATYQQLPGGNGYAFGMWTRGRFFYTKDGYFGLGPTSMLPGDRVAILLGLNCALVIRPAAETNAFSVVGCAYIRGLMDAEAVLGDLPSGWSVKLQSLDGSWTPRFLESTTGVVHEDDPRLPPLSEAEEREIASMDPRYKHDPRLSPEALAKRGVELEMIRLV